MSTETCTTDCPGERTVDGFNFSMILDAFVAHGLDFVNGQWCWAQEERYVPERGPRAGESVIIKQAGSVDRLIANAEERMTKLHAEYEPG